MSEGNNFTPQLTADGSFTFFSIEFQEAYHSHFGAKQEAELKFVKPCKLAEKAQKFNYLRLLDVCYGLGYNTAAALSAIWQVNPKCVVEFIGLEIDEAIAARAIDLLDDYPRWLTQLLAKLATTHQIQTPQLQAKLLFGDARITIVEVLKSNFKADAIFLDPFSPPKCPQLWSVEFLSIVTKCLQPTTGRLATYSCAASVRKALSLSGLKFGSTSALGRRSPGTVASFTDLDLSPLSQQELEHLSTRAAIPYRDPFLQDSAAIIHQRRRSEQDSSNLEPTTHWKKRWLGRS